LLFSRRGLNYAIQGGLNSLLWFDYRSTTQASTSQDEKSEEKGFFSHIANEICFNAEVAILTDQMICRNVEFFASLFTLTSATRLGHRVATLCHKRRCRL
jgi:hypothetical protein